MTQLHSVYRFRFKVCGAACACFLSMASLCRAGEPAWPQFRGPDCSGVADAHPPVQVNPTNSVAWSIDVPWSPSSPSIWGERLFLTTFDSGELQTRCYALRDGQLLWSRGVKPEKLESFHATESSPAAPTPATDGQHVVSYFGSFGVVCYSPQGKELWRHPLPVALSGGGYGTAASPVIMDRFVIVDRDQDRNSSLLALDVSNGKTVWETTRPDATGSFGTPVIWKNQGLEQIVVPGCLRLAGYDLKTGKRDMDRNRHDGTGLHDACHRRGLAVFCGVVAGREGCALALLGLVPGRIRQEQGRRSHL